MFREYDLRGRVSDRELNERSVKLIGRGFASFLNRRKINTAVVGHDFRSYSPKFHAVLISALMESGVNVIDIGQVIAPILYFSQYHLKVKGAVLVTASHNPNGWSGFKLGYDFSRTLLPDDIKELLKIIQDDDFVSGKGSYKKMDVIEAYKKDVLKRIELKKRLKIVIDCGNGTTGPIAPDVFRRIGCDVVEQFCDLDANFPNHDPNPSLVETMEALGKRVREKKADVGLAFDGDGDRIGVCDEKGNNVGADKVLILLARLVLNKIPGSKIIFDVKSTQALEEDIKAHGGEPIMWTTGHSYIKNKLQVENAPLAGEKSGHIFYAEGFYPHDDAIFAGLKLIEYLSAQDRSFSEVMKTIPQFVTSPTYHVDCADDVKYKVVEKLVAEFKAEFPKVIDINGARVVFDDGWGLVRASSNLPVLVLVFEAKTEKRMKEIMNLFGDRLKKYPEIGKKWRSG